MSFIPHDDVSQQNSFPELEQLNSVETALEHLHEIRTKVTDIFQILIGVSKSSSTMNFQRNGLDRLTKLRQHLEKNDSMFTQLGLVYAECVKNEANFDSSKEPELPFAEYKSNQSSMYNARNTAENYSPREEQLLRRKLELEATLEEKRARLKTMMEDLQDMQHLIQSSFPWQSRKY